ncbi:MAG TPA: AraC family transcriptional regulator [Ramlibacter sp.]|nr:AraC family transcriptional regulator [Ramlibacter sp.]
MTGTPPEVRAFGGVASWVLSHHTISIHHVEEALRGARRRGLAVAPLLTRAGIPPTLLQVPAARVSQAQYAALLRVLRWTLGDELWGLLERPVPLGSFAHCGCLLVQAPTVGDAMRTGFRFFHGLLDAFVPRLTVARGEACMTIVPRAPGNEYAQRAFLFLSCGVASWLAASRLPLARVEYRGPPPPQATEVDRLFQAKVAYDCQQYRTCFDARWLQMPVAQNAQSLREFLRQAQANLLLNYRDPANVTDQIRALLRSRLRDELPSLEEVARQLGMAQQTLSRRLREEGQAFQALKDHLRRDAAIELLQRQDLTLIDIAEQLGFSEASTFHRAFKKWTGLGPGEFRRAG